MSLDRLFGLIEDGGLAIPDFQRPFLWSDRQVASLLATVLNGWPAGSLLLLRSDEEWIRLRELDDAPGLTKVRLTLLDGQQRITSLYSAIRNVGSVVYALDLSEGDLLDDAFSLEDRIRAIDRPVWDTDYSDIESQLQAGLMPLFVLRSSIAFFEWRDSALDTMESGREEFRDWITDLYQSNLAPLHRYGFPSVVLEGSPPIAAVARIFEKINRSGTVLGTFDLMVARAYQPGWNLREHWADVLNEHPYVAALTERDGMFALEAMSLRRERDVRRSAVLELPPATIRDQWPNVAEGLVDASEELALTFGVRNRGWLPYRVMLVGLAALAVDRDLTEIAGLPKWFWTRAFGLGFSVAANTRIVSDYVALLEGVDEPSPHDTGVAMPILTHATRRSHRALLGSLMSLLAVHGARDLDGGEFSNPAEFENLGPVSLLGP